MQRWMKAGVLGCMLVAFSATAAAQWRPRDPWRDDDDYRGGRRYRSGVVERTLADLDRIGRFGRLDGHEWRHVESARRNLIRFQDDWQRGRFSRGRLDDAIENLNHLAHADRVHPRDRMMLARDRDMLRDFRSRGRYEGFRPRPW